MSKLSRGYLNSREEGFYIMLEAALAYISGGTEETDIELNNKKTVDMQETYENVGMITTTSKKK